MTKAKGKAEENIIAVEEALTKTEQFIEKNQKIILIGLSIIVAAVLIFFGFNKLYMFPRQKKAEKAMFMAERYFEKDSLDKALNGDGNYYGFLDIIDKYGQTKAGNLARYYAGVCYLQKGEYNTAIKHLKKFSSDDILVNAMAMGAIGDCYVELGDLKEGVSWYMKAANYKGNEFSSPAFLLKAGWTYELLNEWGKAKEAFETIKTKYPKSRENRDLDRFIERAEIKMGKQ